MKHLASAKFWALYEALPEQIRTTADKNFALLKDNPHHPSLHFKKIASLWSARVGEQYRALGKEIDGGILWFWIGTHAEYDKLVR